MDVGREIRRLRESKGWSQAKLAGETGMGISSVSQIETGVRNPSAATLWKIAEALGVGIADLFPKAQSPLPLDYGIEERQKAGSEQRSELTHEASEAFGAAFEETFKRATEDVGPRANKYQDWLDFVDRYADRWEARIAAGDFNMGAVNEFIATVGDVMPVLHALNAAEVRELPEQPGSFGAPGAKTGVAIWRLSDLIGPMAKAGAAKFGDDELAPLRQKYAELHKAGPGDPVRRGA